MNIAPKLNLLRVAVSFLSLSGLGAAQSASRQRIDRKALVLRHNFVLKEFDSQRPVQVGNGEFAFGMDITGLQTFVPFNTMSDWGWISDPPPTGQKPKDFQGQVWDTHGRPVRYPMPDPNHPELSDWLAANPRRINLGRIGFVLTKKDGTLAEISDIQDPRQSMDLWNGLVTSRFALEGVPITVTTACNPTSDTIAVKVDSPLISLGRLAIFLNAPGVDGNQFANFVGDSQNLADLDLLPRTVSNQADLVRPLGNDSYHVSLAWDGTAALTPPSSVAPPLVITKAEYGAGDHWMDLTGVISDRVHGGRLVVHVDNALGGDPIHGTVKRLRVVYHLGSMRKSADAGENEELVIDPIAMLRRFTLKPSRGSDHFSFVCAFSPKPIVKKLESADVAIHKCRIKWPQFWRSGGAIDLSGSRDPRWKELERRLVLSQYLMAVNEAGAYPPQESGLVNNGWFGRFHMEMYWWHAAHWALWNRWKPLNRSLGIYTKLLGIAKKTAAREGYAGARWPKCIGPTGREWPHVIHSLLIWQQPHPIFFAELDYRAHPNPATLKKWQPIVEATADFLAYYAYFEQESGHYGLGPPLVVVSENTDPRTTANPTFELGYWRFGLRVAQEWRQRMGLSPKPLWAKVLKQLAPLPEQNGVYVLHEGVKNMWTQWNFEHPALTGAFGMLPGDGVDPDTMRRTLDKVSHDWNFARTWGWDFPMLAMCAARLGEPDRAIDDLLNDHDGFQFDVRGLATGGPFPYFPSNGGLLYAVAMMAAGWTGGPNKHAPGFPSDGRWKVRFENLSPAP